MKYINLIEKLTTEDKQTLTAYINRYGVISNFIGIDAWLEQWSHSNQKLYRLLGNSFIREFPFKYEKNRYDKIKEIKEFVLNSDFKHNYSHFYWDFIKENMSTLMITEDQKDYFNRLMNTEHFVDNKINWSIKYKKPGASKMLQIQAGVKPLKAIYRVIEYFKDDYDWNLDAFENFKKQFGIIYSDNIVTGKMCISIHPMDYITMSDNASNWQSCMSWMENGCYHVGTIEMMNSNNVLCCYLTNDNTPFEFTDKETGEVIGTWNNKKWRKLFYFNKDIIMGGKAYPYISKELTIAILDEIKKLAKENLNYDYEFGPELYHDMTHVTTMHRVEKQKMWAKSKSTQKHNIIWDTKGMYNDMLNDEDYEYWCYRNKVKHTKVISVSGKANCLCCNESIIHYNEDMDYNEYNERYDNTGSSVCWDCTEQYFKCSFCNGVSYTRKFEILKDGRKVCANCMSEFRICPCCGKVYNPDGLRNRLDVYNNSNIYNYVKDIHESTIKMLELQDILEKNYIGTYYYWTKDDIDEESSSFNPDWNNHRIEVEKLACCDECMDKLNKELKEHSYFIGHIPYSWLNEKDIYIVNPEYAEPYRMFNLKKASIEDLNALIMAEAS